MTIVTAERTDRARAKKYFLPYQERWLWDERRYKEWEKSRRIGATYVVSYGHVRRAVKVAKRDRWFSSADESAAKEYILYCRQWAEIFEKAAEYLGEIVIDKKNDITAFALQFANGNRIHALRSNPKAFRSKGGDVTLDEFAHHDDQREMWRAARPVIQWGGDIELLSTHNGKGFFFQMVDEAKRKAATTKWSLHSTDIFLAVREGLADKIVGRKLSPAEREAWLDEQRETCLDEEAWQQEFCCIPMDEATAFLTYDLIAAIEDELAGDPGRYAGGRIFIGNDIARRGDLWVAWVVELVGDVLWTREVSILKGQSFAAQDAEMDRLTRAYPAWERLCMDQTGMGEKPVEDAKRRYGDHKVEGVLMTAAVQQELAFAFKRTIEDRQFRAPKTADVRDDFHSVKKVTTTAGNIRFDAERTKLGHADRFWAASLACHAAGLESAEPGIRSLAPSLPGPAAA